MTHKFIVTTDQGRPESLKEPIKIAFTLTPVDAEGSTRSYDPIARWVTNFSATGGQSVTVEWDDLTIFGSYWNGPDGRCYSLTALSPVVPPGFSITGTKAWSTPVPHLPTTPNCDSIVYHNGSQGATYLMLTRSSGWALVAYHPTTPGSSVVVPRELKLQAYIVSNLVVEYTILEPADLTRPLFTTPINDNDLPAFSTWRLCQDSGSAIRLKNDEYPELDCRTIPAFKPTTIMETSSGEKLLERLAMMEISPLKELLLGQMAALGIQTQLELSQSHVESTKDDVAALEISLSIISDQILILNHSVAAVQTTTATLSAFFSQSQDRLSEAQKAVADVVQRPLSWSFNNNQAQFSSGQIAGVDHHVAVERSSDKQERSRQDQLSSLRKALRTMDRRISVLETRAGTSEAPSDQTQEELLAIQRSIIALDRRLTIIESGRAGGDSGLEDYVEVEAYHSSPSAQGSPVMLPSDFLSIP